MEVPGWLCHTQPVERAIRSLDEAGSHVVDPEDRDVRSFCHKQYLDILGCKKSAYINSIFTKSMKYNI